MYSISFLSRRQQDFISSLSIRNINKNPATTIALARVVSRLVPVPGSVVSSVDSYFRQQGQGVITVILDDINSIVPIDYLTVMDLALQFFRYSYDTIHGPILPVCDGYEHGLSHFFRLNQHISKETLTIIAERHRDMSVLIEEFQDIVNTIQKGKEHVA